MAVANLPHFYPSYYKYPEFPHACIIIYCQSTFYHQYLRTTNFSVANHNTECKKVSNCKYHVMVTAKDVQTIFRKFENTSFIYQIVNDMYYTFRTFMTHCVLYQGNIFYLLRDALSFNKLIPEYEKERGIHIKRVKRMAIRRHKNKFLVSKGSQTSFWFHITA